MKCNLEKYQVISTYNGGAFKEDILNGATVSIEGAIFQLERVYTKTGHPTKVFQFTNCSGFVDNDSSKELIELGWNHCTTGMIKIGKELGLKYKMGASAFSLSDAKPHYMDVN